MAKNQGKQEVKDFSDIPEGWEEEATSGFPPYWSPGEGKSFRGRILARDVRDPNFIRYVVEASETTECVRGSGDDAEPVMVEKGQQFTVSDYFALDLRSVLGLEIKATSTEKVRTKGGNDVWLWKLAMPPEARKILHARRAESAALFDGKKSDSEQLIS